MKKKKLSEKLGNLYLSRPIATGGKIDKDPIGRISTFEIGTLLESKIILN